MKFLSLFTGIGGFELGINQAYESLCNADGSEERGIKEDKKRNQRQGLFAKEGEDINTEERPVSERSPNFLNQRPLCIGYSEIDKYAVQIYQKHFPEHINYGDITQINAEKLPDFDLLCGGFPCQAFSIAGKRGGFADTRGTLFFDIARILEVKRPRLLLLENVKGLLSHDNGGTFKTIISTLDELGYDLQWQVLNSKNFGVPQNRERVFIVGHLRGTSRPEVFPITGTATKTDTTRELSEPISNCLRTNYSNGKSNETYIRQLNNPTHSNDRVYGTDGVSPTLNTMQGGNRQPFIANTLDANYHKGNSATKERHTPRTEVMQDMKIRRLTPIECERLQGFPDNWTEGVSDTQRYKQCGNAVTVNVIEAIIQKLLF